MIGRPAMLGAELIAAVAVNAALFGALIALQHIWDDASRTQESPARVRRTVTEIIRPPEQREQQQTRRIRQVRTAQSRSLAGEMAMDFVPDLSAAGAGAGVAVPEQNLAAAVFEEGETDTDPIPKTLTPIDYPERARDLGIEGVLVVELVIGVDGRVESVNVVRSPHPSIAAAARKTVMRWRFEPARKDGVPVRVRARKQIEFQLD